MRVKRVSHRLAGVAMALTGVAAADAVEARVLEPGEVEVVDGTGGVAEEWFVRKGAILSLKGGALAAKVEVQGGSLHMDAANVRASTWGLRSADGTLDIRNSSIHALDGVAIRLDGSLVPLPGGGPSSVHMVRSAASGSIAGAAVDGRSSLVVAGSSITGTGEGSAGVIVISGSARLLDGTDVRGEASGISFGSRRGGSRGTSSEVVIEGSTVSAAQGAAIHVEDSLPADATVNVWLRSGAVLQSDVGVAALVDKGSHLKLFSEDSTIRGHVHVAEGGSADIELGRGALLLGNIRGGATVKVERGANWTIDETSAVNHLRLLGGHIGFAEGLPGRRLYVSGDVDGSGGEIALNVDAGSLSGRAPEMSDHVLIGGDVHVPRPINVSVNLSGTPISTDSNGDGISGADEGASLVKVAGSAKRGAFRIKGGYLTAGPYQYELKGFGPGEKVAAGTASDEGDTGWDYRLVSRFVCESGGETRPGSDQGSGAERPAVAPQLASYLSTSGAVFAYADGIATNLHERLGEIRDHAFEGSVGGEVFARYAGRSQRYSSNRAFKNYGYDFDERVEAWQFGGSVVGLDGDNGSLRAGWAVDHGRSSVTPRAVDGESVTRLKANGTSAWITWRSGNGFWMDWVVGRQALRGQTDTAMGGKRVGRVKATATGTSLGAGWPQQITPDWRVESHMLVAVQQVNVNPIREDGGLKVRFAGRRYVTGAVGVSLFHEGPVLSPYVRLDARSTSGGGGLVAGTDGNPKAARFEAGRVGHEYLVSSGATAQLTPRLQLFGEGSYRHYLGSGGFQGWSGNVGMRLTF
jgi:outer membrane autotransporter protein